jgi:hypothetical protein
MAELPDDPLRRLVRDRPYAREFVLDTMDPDLIQRHGELLLSRAVNIGRIVAFVGAGVSMSYGRISWRELVRELLDSAEESFLEAAQKYRIERDRDYEEDHPRIKIIYETLAALKPPENADTDGAWRDMPPARLLILFQIADELGEAIHRLDKSATHELNPVRREARQLVYDDAGHARRLFESSYKNRKEGKNSGDDAIKELFSYLERRPLTRDLSRVQPPYQTIFDKKALAKLIETIPADLQPFKDLCKQFCGTAGSQAKPIYLNPTHRFVVAALLATRSASESNRLIEGWAPDYLRTETKPSTQQVAPERAGAPKTKSQRYIKQLIEDNEPSRFRDETVDHERDPLQLLINRLGVRRFITTNYDLDIERMMLDRGYRLRLPVPADGPNGNFIAESVNAMEARARDFVFEERRAAHLIDFAVQDGRFALDVVHLHGRATDGDDIVATEADYCIRTASGSPDKHCNESRAAQILAENTEDAIVAGFLSAIISRLQNTWASWRDEWFGDISPRLPFPREKDLELAEEDSSDLLAKGAKIDRRRAIDLPPDYNLPPTAGAAAEGDDSGGRFRIRTSQTLAQACLALSRHVEARGAKTSMHADGRRVFILAGERGIGKGHFFSALTEGRGLFKFLGVTWENTSEDQPNVTRIMNVLLDKQHEKARVDIIFITDEKGIPIEFRERARRKFQKQNDARMPKETPPARWSLEIVRSPGDHLRGEAEDDAAATRLGLSREEPKTEGETPQAKNVAIFLRLRPAMLGIVAAAAFPRTLAAIVCVARNEKARLSLDRLIDLGKQAQQMLEDQAKLNAANAGVIERYEYVGELAKLGSDDSPDGIARIDKEFGAYFKAFGRNRFATTVAFAVADEELVVEENSKLAIDRTLGRIRDEVSGIDDPSREDSIVRAAIAIHRRRGVRKKAFPKILDKTLKSFSWKDRDKERKEARLFARLSEVCEELLVVLSMIGYPIEQDCLATLEFRAWDDWKKDFGEEPNQRTQLVLVAAALQILVQRCLVFRFNPIVEIKPTPGSTQGIDELVKRTERFGVHRHVQRHIFRQLKQPFVEHAEIESYMPTLYASQPNDLPYPTIAAQTRIREIVATLSRYPSAKRLHEPGQGHDERPELQSRMLRAAYGAIRTVYGVGVVARFNEFGDRSKPPAVGYFEEHRQQVRWLLKRAKEVERLLKDELTNAEQAFERYAKSLPFYSGDIAWLYNECGVLSLVQGRLNDASKLFSESMRALLPIERRGTPAALTAAVRLNRALVDIELGNLPKAETALRDITAQQDEHRAVRWIAFGYRGLIEHIRGNLKEAKSRYDGAVEVLIELKRNRAASIFSRHCADLCRQLKGEDNLKLAEALADNAVNLAAAGSHADVLHQARLSRLRIQADRRGATSYATLRKELEVIETYAKVMGMPRLEVETSYVDAYFRQQLGDLTMAMKAVTRSLAIANDCDLVLRKIGGTLLAAEISRDLGMPDGARTLAETAMVMATTAEFSAAQDKAQTILATL